MAILKEVSSDLLFDALVNAPVSDREWAEALVGCASKGQSLYMAMRVVFQLEGLYMSPKKFDRVKEASQRLNPKTPKFTNSAYTCLTLVCDNFTNASKCIFANKYPEAVEWMLSGKDTKRVVMPKKPSGRPRRQGARLILNNFRERDDGTAWNKCK